MISIRVLRFAPLAHLLACAAAMATSTGCATAVTPKWPSPANDTAWVPVQAAPAAALAAAHHADRDVLAACAIGALRVVAGKAAPPAGVEADADASHVWLRFAEKAGTRVLVALDPRSLEVVATNDSAPSMLEEARYMALSAWPEPPLAARRAASAEKPAGNHAGGEEGSDGSRRSLPVVTRVDASRSVLAWTEGSIYGALDVRVQTVGSDGEPIGDAVIVPHDGSAIGQPAVAVAPSGLGVVAFLDSDDHGFALVAASLDCPTPASIDTAPAWASR